MNSPLTSAAARSLTSEAEARASESGAALIAAEHAHRISVRRALLSGDHAPADSTASAVAEARTAHERATSALAVARDILGEAINAERSARLATLRDATEARIATIEAAGREADEALAVLLGKVATLRRIEDEARAAIRDVRPGREPVVNACRDVLADIAAHFRALASGLTPVLEPFASIRAVKATNRLRDAVATGD